MEQKELKIVPPEGYEIDTKNSTLECIKFKKKAHWRDNEDAIIRGYFISGFSEIIELDGRALRGAAGKNVFGNYNVFATKALAKSARAMARISQIMANDKRFGGSVTDKEWETPFIDVYSIVKRDNKINYSVSANYSFLAFHTPEQRDLFLEENRDLVKDYLMIS